MKNGILIGTAFGMIIGALLVNNNQRVREMVSDTQQCIKDTMQRGKDAMAKKNCCCSENSQQGESAQNSESEDAQSDYMN